MVYIQKQKRFDPDKSSTHTNYALYYHLVWGTKTAAPFIDQQNEQPLKEFLIEKSNELDITILELEIVSNHVHWLISLKPTHFIPDIIQKLKGSSSHYLNQSFFEEKNFQWERGYSIRTVSEKNLEIAKEYIRSQKIRHRD